MNPKMNISLLKIISSVELHIGNERDFEETFTRKSSQGMCLMRHMYLIGGSAFEDEDCFCFRGIGLESVHSVSLICPSVLPSC